LLFCQDDEDIVLEAVKNKGKSLQYASHKLKSDRNIVLEAIKKNGLALKYASIELLNSLKL